MAAARKPSGRRGPGRTLLGLGCIGVAILLFGAVIWAAWTYNRVSRPPTPLEDQCRVTAVVDGEEHTVRLTTEQAENAAIIVGIALQRGLPARAATIAIATAYQESGIRNIDYGDRDSIGLFQQRPSQGWGTVEEIMDPYYSAGKFYDALVKIPNWQTGDINDVAQAVQRSGVPEGYRKHVTNARAIGSSMTGHSPASWTCHHSSPAAADPDGLRDYLDKTLGAGVTGEMSVVDRQLEARPPEPRLAWAVAVQGVAQGSRFGVASVTLEQQRWQLADDGLPDWQPIDVAIEGVAIGF
ncbi:hypothetical protein [Parenemella sanctibonifatiensis]|uniref:Cobalt transporter n=1 Tax=Parenemella sanctibonifatiensis TaxID=2016505 RepID=A0A255EDF5_9ACTN|nr:hypothetical protein [Parenemella sanctibonifatiensis]OYN89576.1 hypothetical protein CGZ92_02305 [Parenemella sanctibonifatiensis]